MSTTIEDGGIYQKDPNAVRVLEFDWDADLASGAQIASHSFTITGPDAALTKDNESIVSGGRSAKVRLIGGTRGRTYTLTHRYTTNETPTQTDDASVSVVIRNR